ncbi:MAG: hypothetical protein Fur0022_47830 [Anaerolineales bacterium]
MRTRPWFILLFLIPGVILFIAVGSLFSRDLSTPTLILATNFSEPKLVSADNNGPKRVYAADVDGDGDMDILSISLLDNKVAWYANTDGDGAFGPQQIISTEIAGGDGISAGDVDGDGDVDVFSASSADGKVAWYTNQGAGVFGPQQIINALAPMAYFVFPADLDGDHDLDILYDAWDMNAVIWQENLDGQGNFGPVNVISSQAEGASSVFAADLDGDGDLDALTSAALGNQIIWYKNTDGQGSFSLPIVITNNVSLPYSVIAADLDQDGDLDVLSASSEDNKIAWYENMDGLGGFGLQKVITSQAEQASSVYAIDLDGDGDLDVLSASYGDNIIAWYANEGNKRFGARQVITDQAIGTFSVIASDIDGDGDMDVIAAAVEGDQILWFENMTPHILFFPVIFHNETIQP